MEIAISTTIAIVCATILGPILAVQVQKFIERSNQSHNRKVDLFEQLMATRAARLSFEHVRALNMIDIYFYGKGPLRRSKTEQSVIDSWKIYFSHLNEQRTPETLAIWISKADDYFIDLMLAISEDVGFKFDKVQLKNSSYSPIRHLNIELENESIRNATLEILEGKRSINMHLDNLNLPERNDH